MNENCKSLYLYNSGSFQKASLPCGEGVCVVKCIATSEGGEAWMFSGMIQ
jgi:hypothetical protein